MIPPLGHQIFSLIVYCSPMIRKWFSKFRSDFLVKWLIVKWFLYILFLVSTEIEHFKHKKLSCKMLTECCSPIPTFGMPHGMSCIPQWKSLYTSMQHICLVYLNGNPCIPQSNTYVLYSQWNSLDIDSQGTMFNAENFSIVTIKVLFFDRSVVKFALS